MNFVSILYALLALGALGAIFGFVLDIADKKFAVKTDERVAAVREAVEAGEIDRQRHSRYAALLEEQRQRWRERYD